MVYGGACVGLMGAVADAALAGGAEVIGVLPAVLTRKEIAHAGLTRWNWWTPCIERKARKWSWRMRFWYCRAATARWTR